MRFVEVLLASVLIGCSGAAVDPLGDAAVDAGEDHRLGVGLDAGDADSAPKCQVGTISVENDTESCEPVVDSFCANTCDHAFHYRCSSFNRPATIVDGGYNSPLDCVDVGDAGDTCCTASKCVLAKAFATSCAGAGYYAYACPSGTPQPFGITNYCQATNNGDVTDPTATFWCCF